MVGSSPRSPPDRGFRYRRQLRTRIDQRIQPAVPHRDKSSAAAGACSAPPGVQLGERRLGDSPHRLEPAVDDFDRLSRQVVAVLLQMRRMEGVHELVHPLADWARERHDHLEVLSLVARVRVIAERTVRRRARSRSSHAPASRFHGREVAAHTTPALGVSAAISLRTKSNEMSVSSMPRAHIVPGSCGTTTAESALGRDLHRVQRPAPPYAKARTARGCSRARSIPRGSRGSCWRWRCGSRLPPRPRRKPERTRDLGFDRHSRRPSSTSSRPRGARPDSGDAGRYARR